MRQLSLRATLLVALLYVPAARAAGVEVIQAYTGTWKIQTEHFATRFSKAGTESSTLKNDCWSSAGYFACDQFVNGESKDLIIFTRDPKEDIYHSYSVPADGGEAQSGKLLIKGNVWTFPWEDKQDGKTIYFHVVNVFTAPGAIEYRQEFSEDQVHWTVMAKGLERKTD